MNSANYRRLINNYEQIIDRIRLIFINVSKDIVADDDIIIVINRDKE